MASNILKSSDSVKKFVFCLDGIYLDTKFQEKGNDPTKKQRLGKRGITLFDHCINFAIISPCVVISWHGLWDVMDLCQNLFPDVNSFVFGMLLHCCFALIRPKTGKKKKQRDDSKLNIGIQRLMSRLYAYVFLWANIFHWRGGWLLYDKSVVRVSHKLSMRPSTVHLICCALILLMTILLKSVRNLISSPYIVVMDRTRDTFIFPTRFNVANTKEMALYILDCVFSVSVVGSLVLFVWRGTWSLLDIYIYPTDPIWSSFGSLVLGYAMVIVSFSAQSPMRWTCSRLHGAWRVAVADVFLAFSFVATVNVWRGIWQLMDIYFLSDNKMASDWISHSVSLLLLVTMNCSNSVLVRGVYIDAEEQAGECVLFPCHYLRLIVHQQRGEKRRRRLTLAAVERLNTNASVPLVDGADAKVVLEKAGDQPTAVHWQSNEKDDSKPFVIEKK